MKQRIRKRRNDGFSQRYWIGRKLNKQKRERGLFGLFKKKEQPETEVVGQLVLDEKRGTYYVQPEKIKFDISEPPPSAEEIVKDLKPYGKISDKELKTRYQDERPFLLHDEKGDIRRNRRSFNSYARTFKLVWPEVKEVNPEEEDEEKK